ncbi:hypothetical protein ACP6EK_06375 [Candidatus Caldatribacterium sp. SIUC1]|uniref:hypothetical protein n=1 Tax=Candidatus Caldatribacterium sp. SIUC1 TaxID=3418365 RepID=UPI003F68F461
MRGTSLGVLRVLGVCRRRSAPGIAYCFEESRSPVRVDFHRSGKEFLGFRPCEGR